MSFEKSHVILVNEKDELLGTMEKMEAHQKGLLHRAFSVFILNDRNELLIQQRAEGKYHSQGLWSNTCCSHPIPGESTLQGAHRRLKEEMGFDCALSPLFHLHYMADVGNGLTENEFDHIYVGHYNQEVVPDPREVQRYQFIPVRLLADWMEKEPEVFTYWFRLALPGFLKHLQL